MLTEILSSVEFWKIAFPAIAAIFAWYMNERSKLAWEQYKRKEENYKEVLRCLKGFYVAAQDRALKDQFLSQVNLLWLYAPDSVITAAYAFLDTVKSGAGTSQEQRDKAAGELVSAVRTDLLSRRIVSRTSLTADHFRHLQAN